MTTKIFKIAHNRGKPRVWMEGKFLLNAGITTGMKFARLMPNPETDIETDANTMVLRFLSWGSHTVAGTDTRPIIDLNGAYLNQIFEGFTHYEADITGMDMQFDHEKYGQFRTEIFITGVNQ